MKQFKLPFRIDLTRKYNDINIEKYLNEKEENTEKCQERCFKMDNELHVELGKFTTYDVSIDEVIDLGMRYALAKQEFRKMIAQLIEIKKQKIQFK